MLVVLFQSRLTFNKNGCLAVYLLNYTFVLLYFYTHLTKVLQNFNRYDKNSRCHYNLRKFSFGIRVINLKNSFALTHTKTTMQKRPKVRIFFGHISRVRAAGLQLAKFAS